MPSPSKLLPSAKGPKPLFIPLKTKFYRAFEAGLKTEEFRVEGPRWNPMTCRVGRPVILSHGYGKRERLHGFVVAYRVERNPHANLPGWSECYPQNPKPAACIAIGIKRTK